MAISSEAAKQLMETLEIIALKADEAFGRVRNLEKLLGDSTYASKMESELEKFHENQSPTLSPDRAVQIRQLLEHE